MVFLCYNLENPNLHPLIFYFLKKFLSQKDFVATCV